MLSRVENSPEKRSDWPVFKNLLRKVFLEDWVMKLVALVITLALWVGVTGLSTPTTTRMSGVPLTLRFSNNTEVTNSPVQEVDIVISGDKRKIDQINKNDLIVSLDLTDVSTGERVIQLTPENVTVPLPTGVKLDEIQPNKIAVRLETVEEKEIPVKAEIEGDVPEGFEIYSETVSPPKVLVRGPAGFIRSLMSVSTESIDLSGRSEDFSVKQVPINVSNPKATPLETVVDITFRIGEKRIERLYLVPVNNDYEKKATVVLFGGKSLFDDIRADDLRVENVKTPSGEVTPQLIFPPRLEGKVEIRQLKLDR